MLLIAGLGNPGNKYLVTRHNVGFIIIDYLVQQLNLTLDSNKFKSVFTQTIINNNKVIFLKPQTFMNLSGDAILQVSQFYKIPLDNIIVIHDDIYLPTSTIRYKVNSGDGGQKGIMDISNKLGKSFHRLKVGVGSPENKNISISDYVLSNFNKEELKGFVYNICEYFYNNLNTLIEKDFNKFINNFSNIQGK